MSSTSPFANMGCTCFTWETKNNRHLLGRTYDQCGNLQGNSIAVVPQNYLLDETFGEDKSTIKLGKNTMSLLRKCAYNIARMLQMKNPEEQGGIPDIIDNVCDNLEIGLQMIFRPIPSRY